LNYKRLSKIGIGALLSSLPLFAVDAQLGKEIINSKCTACHIGNLDEGLSRISDQRKTPEGWYMTLNRMQRIHGLSLTAEEQSNVIKYLSDNQGLTPDEIKPYTYVLDKTPNFQKPETNPELFNEMCVRCHSEARIGLQRRTAPEWESLVNFHVGQFISFEAQALARDRDWFEIAKKEIVPLLAERFGKDEATWTSFKESIKDYETPTEWSFYGHTPSKGDFSAKLTLSKDSDSNYSVEMSGNYENGSKFEAKGKTIVYAKTELRSTFEIDGVKYRQILHIDPKTSTAEGRMFEVLHTENGSVLSGVALNTKDVSIVGIYPNALKTGETSTITIVGNNLNSKLDFGKNIKVSKILKEASNEVVVEVAVDKNAKLSTSDIKVADKDFKNALTTYEKIDYIKVTPDYAIARDGGNDTTDAIQKEYATFEAYGYSFGKDGKKGTADDVKLTVLPAIWNMKPYDEQAIEDKDIQYAGSINRYTGVFTPSEAGPNPVRKLMANNVGNLTITATYIKNNQKLEGESHLIVAVPKFINPPIN
jgi:quinohemoprotein amine dehydrogenase